MFVIALLFVFLQSLKLKYREMSQKEQNVNNAQAVGEAVSGVEKFLKKNGKVITWAVVGVIALVAILFAYHNWVKLPNIEEYGNLWIEGYVRCRHFVWSRPYL